MDEPTIAHLEQLLLEAEANLEHVENAPQNEASRQAQAKERAAVWKRRRELGAARAELAAQARERDEAALREARRQSDAAEMSARAAGRSANQARAAAVVAFGTFLLALVQFFGWRACGK